MYDLWIHVILARGVRGFFIRYILIVLIITPFILNIDGSLSFW
jgi:hypothetical protein